MERTPLTIGGDDVEQSTSKGLARGLILLAALIINVYAQRLRTTP